MELRTVATFLRVAELQSFSRAAEQVRRPSSISQLHRLSDPFFLQSC